MIEGNQKFWALALPALMIAIGLCFSVMGFAGYPALLVTGIFYTCIGLRGIRVMLLRDGRPPRQTTLGRPYS